MTKVLKVTVSGSYKTANRDVIDYESLTGIIPMIEDDLILSTLIHRFVPMWLAKDKRYPKRQIGIVREVFIDKTETVIEKCPIAGLSIAKMETDDLQWLASMYDLRNVPVFRQGGIITARKVAYIEYTNTFDGREYSKEEKNNLNLNEEPEVIIDGLAVADSVEPDKITNEDMIKMEQDSTANPKQTLTREELEEIAKSKNIRFNPKIGDENLYKKIFQ